MRPVWLLAACLAAGCPRAGLRGSHGPIEVQYIGAALCVSTFPEAGPVPAADREAFLAARTSLTQGDFAGATEALAEAGRHPALGAIRAVAVADASPETGYRTLFELGTRWPQDACTQRSLALLALMSGADAAAAHGERAWRLAPESPQNALVYLITNTETAGYDDRLRAVLDRHGDNPEVNAFIGLYFLESADPARAIPALVVAHEGGINVVEPLLDATWETGDRPTYLRTASRAGLLGDDGAIARADDPVAAHRELVGAGPGGLRAILDTSEGPIRCALHTDDAPIAVASFVGLAAGRIPWQLDGEPVTDPLYDGTTFHRVIPGFMIQGGDPTGTGRGGPGYQFRDEISASASFTERGVLAMANSGPNTNGSQFFITDAPAPHLTGSHTVFGQCQDHDIVARIARVPRDGHDKPETPVVLERLRFEPIP